MFRHALMVAPRDLASQVKQFVGVSRLAFLTDAFWKTVR